MQPNLLCSSLTKNLSLSLLPRCVMYRSVRASLTMPNTISRLETKDWLSNGFYTNSTLPLLRLTLTLERGISCRPPIRRTISGCTSSATCTSCVTVFTGLFTTELLTLSIYYLTGSDETHDGRVVTARNTPIRTADSIYLPGQRPTPAPPLHAFCHGGIVAASSPSAERPHAVDHGLAVPRQGTSTYHVTSIPS